MPRALLRCEDDDQRLYPEVTEPTVMTVMIARLFENQECPRTALVDLAGVQTQMRSLAGDFAEDVGRAMMWVSSPCL
jgi:hypothetical protein